MVDWKNSPAGSSEQMFMGKLIACCAETLWSFRDTMGKDELGRLKRTSNNPIMKGRFATILECQKLLFIRTPQFTELESLQELQVQLRQKEHSQPNQSLVTRLVRLVNDSTAVDSNKQSALARLRPRIKPSVKDRLGKKKTRKSAKKTRRYGDGRVEQGHSGTPGHQMVNRGVSEEGPLVVI